MYLGICLIEAGKNLVPANKRPKSEGRPDICISDGDRKIWIEAITPARGITGNDQVPDLVPYSIGDIATFVPTRQLYLRISSALWEKTKKIKKYFHQEIINPDDITIIAINGYRISQMITRKNLPYILNVVFPIGDPYVVFDCMSQNEVELSYWPSYEIERKKCPVQRTAFLDKEFSAISGVLWSNIGLGNMNRDLRPLDFVHNPFASIPLPKFWGPWDREYVAEAEAGNWTVTNILGQTANR